jgi:hypothetical protein
MPTFNYVNPVNGSIIAQHELLDEAIILAKDDVLYRSDYTPLLDGDEKNIPNLERQRLESLMDQALSEYAQYILELNERSSKKTKSQLISDLQGIDEDAIKFATQTFTKIDEDGMFFAVKCISLAVQSDPTALSALRNILLEVIADRGLLPLVVLDSNNLERTDFSVNPLSPTDTIGVKFDNAFLDTSDRPINKGDFRLVIDNALLSKSNIQNLLNGTILKQKVPFDPSLI